MFFRVVETSKQDGLTRVTVEAEDSALKILLDFLSTASEFAYLFRYKSEADLKAKDRRAERLAKEPSRRAHGIEILSLYRSMKGVPQHKRYQRIRELMKERGSDYTYSRVEGLVTRAIHDEQDEKRSKAGVPSSKRIARVQEIGTAQKTRMRGAATCVDDEDDDGIRAEMGRGVYRADFRGGPRLGRVPVPAK